MPAEVKRRYFELIRRGWSGVGGRSAGRGVVELRVVVVHRRWAVSFVETPISPRYLSQDDRIEIADGSPGVSRSSRSRPDRQVLTDRLPRDRPEPQARRTLSAVVRAQPGLRAAATPQAARFAVDTGLREVVAGKLASTGPRRRSAVGCGGVSPPAQLARVPRDDLRGRLSRPDCPGDRQNLRTGRTYRHRRGRGRSRDGRFHHQRIEQQTGRCRSVVAASAPIGMTGATCRRRRSLTVARLQRQHLDVAAGCSFVPGHGLACLEDLDDDGFPAPDAGGIPATARLARQPWRPWPTTHLP